MLIEKGSGGIDDAQTSILWITWSLSCKGLLQARVFPNGESPDYRFVPQKLIVAKQTVFNLWGES